MRFLNQFLHPVKKFSKGMFALLTLNLFIVLCAFIFDSCKKENNYAEKTDSNIEEQLINFRSTMLKAGKTLSSYSPTTARSVTNNGSETGPDPNDPNTPDEPGDAATREEYALYFVSQTEAAALQLILSYGITKSELLDALDIQLGDKVSAGMLTLIAQSISETENLIDNGRTLPIFENTDYSLAALRLFGVNSASAQAQDTFGGCLADAIGITAAFEIVEKGVAGLGKKGVLKIIRKIGGRALGPIGAALAAYDFGDCMDWW